VNNKSNKSHESYFDDKHSRHRDDDLPALINSAKIKWFYFHGKPHRTFGPSYECHDDEICWTFLGKDIIDA